MVQTGGVAITYRISSSTRGDEALICIQGDLDGEGAEALRRECRSAGAIVRLDLSGLRSANRDGIEALRSLAAEGAELTGASPYVLQLLKEGIE
jgi:anti-anti-sigma regulatory factor